MKPSALRHPAVAVPLAGGPLRARGPLEAPGVLQRPVGPGGGDVLARGVALARRRPCRGSGLGGQVRRCRPRARCACGGRPPGRTRRVRAPRCRRCRTCRARPAGRGRPSPCAAGASSLPSAQRPTTSQRNQSAPASACSRRAEPDDLEPAQPPGGLVPADVRRPGGGRPSRPGAHRADSTASRWPSATGGSWPTFTVTEVCGAGRDRARGVDRLGGLGAAESGGTRRPPAPVAGWRGAGRPFGVRARVGGGFGTPRSSPERQATSSRRRATAGARRLIGRSSPSTPPGGCRPSTRPRGTTCSRTRSSPGSSSTLLRSPSRSPATVPARAGRPGRGPRARRA